MVNESWIRVGRAPTGPLVEARLQAHFAAQVPAAVGATLLPAREDFSHTALTFGAGTLWSGLLPSGDRVGLRLRDLTVLVASSGPTTAEAHEVAGSTLAELLAWVRDTLSHRGPTPVQDLHPPPHDLPVHPVADGGRFKGASSVALKELSAWYHNADRLLRAVMERDGAGPVRTWPHHFDMATLIHISDEGPLQSIGVGLSPGDEHQAEPYLYVTPWPYPARAPDTRGLAPGVWRTDGFTGAVLPAAEVGALKAPADQEKRARAFLAAGISICASLGAGA